MELNRTSGLSMLWRTLVMLMAACMYLLWGTLGKLVRACIYRVLSKGPIPHHFAFIMDGNRRYAKKHSLDVQEGHKAGSHSLVLLLKYLCELGVKYITVYAFSIDKKHSLDVQEGHKAGSHSLVLLLKYLCELGVKYITVYAFSIDNFKRKPEQVLILMELLRQKTLELLEQESIVYTFGIRVMFIGNLNLLDKPLKEAAEKVMAATAENTKAMLLICVAYTSTEEIVHAVRETCKEKCDNNPASNVKVVDLEKHFYMAVAPEPDILIRSAGSTRLSNFLLWQTAYCPLDNPDVLWPGIGFFHIILAILSFQRNYVDKRICMNI